MTKNSYAFKFLTFLLLSSVTMIVACSSMKKKQVVAEIGNEKIYLYEYEKQFLKSNPNIDSARSKSLQDRKDFLDLLIKFRLKVKDARERGLLASADIQNDINEYKKNFLSAFLIDKKIVEPHIKDLYDMKKYEVRASHILINLPQTANAEDSIKAYKKADDAIKELKDGVDFVTVAKKYSDDFTVQQNNGDLYYFTAGMTVPEFEEEVYSLKVGDYSKKPRRTMYGLHIVKLTDKRPRFESIRASHILLQDTKDSLGNTVDSIGNYNKAKSILDRIKNGEDFAKLATEFSQDPGSAPKGGDLGFFDRRRMVQAFDSAAFTLKPGQVSGLVRTQFGWHIIKLTDVKEYSSFDKQKDNLKQDYKKGKAFKDEYAKYIENAKKNLDFKMDDNAFNFVKSKFDETKTIGSYNFDSLFSASERQKTIATFKDGTIKVEDIITFYNRNRDLSNSFASAENVKKLLDGASELPMLNAMAIKDKIEKDADYIELLTEYENGLLSFKIDQEELWSKIKITNEDMIKYYDANKTKYQYTENNETKIRAFDDVKAEISNTLQQEKFKELENEYVNRLRTKYPVKINEKVLMEAFKD
ncbi:MAG: peptidylprolyl isomerase [Ignavibacteria bacterium]|nr:peptidylprolyl isomerase [Ignavibacteria bacterium]